MKKLLGIVVLGLLFTNNLHAIHLKDTEKKYYNLEHVPDCIVPDNITDLQFHRKWTDCFGELFNMHGHTYAGEWKNGKPHGKGTFYVDYKNNEERYVGDWENGEFNGNGVYVEANGKTYIGEFQNNKRHGKGDLIWPNGSIRRVIYDNGEIINYFKNSKFEKKAKAKKKYLTIPERFRSKCDRAIVHSKKIENTSILNKSYEKHDLKIATRKNILYKKIFLSDIVSWLPNHRGLICVYSESYKLPEKIGDKYKLKLGELGHHKTPALTIVIDPINKGAWFSKNFNGQVTELGTCIWDINQHFPGEKINMCWLFPTTIKHQNNVSLEFCYRNPCYIAYGGNPEDPGG